MTITREERARLRETYAAWNRDIKQPLLSEQVYQALTGLPLALNALDEMERERDEALASLGYYSDEARQEAIDAREEMKARAEKAEASAAVMRNALVEVATWMDETPTACPDCRCGDGDHEPDCRANKIDKALATDAGSALLAERDALRVEVEMLRYDAEAYRSKGYYDLGAERDALKAKVARIEASAVPIWKVAPVGADTEIGDKYMVIDRAALADVETEGGGT